jgi:hypothetical protein
MTINELIKKYEEEINKMYGVSTVDEHRFLKDIAKVERVISLKEILQDLKQLKEKIIKRQFTKSYISTNQDNSLMAVESMIKEIIGE